MLLYGSAISKYNTGGCWQLEVPEFWSEDKTYVKTHPYLHLPDHKWGSLSLDSFNFYEMEIEYMDEGFVFDLRSDRWREKLLTFMKYKGNGWSQKGGLYKDFSPLDHLLYRGNLNLVAGSGYKWAVYKHRLEADGNEIELWHYLSLIYNPAELYKLRQVEIQEFFQ